MPTQKQKQRLVAVEKAFAEAKEIERRELYHRAFEHLDYQQIRAIESMGQNIGPYTESQMAAQEALLRAIDIESKHTVR